MILKRNIAQFIPNCKNYFFAILALFFCLQSSEAQFFKVENPCSIDYSSLGLPPIGTPVTPGTATPQDPSTIYFTNTTFTDESAGSSDWSWDFGDSTPIEIGKIVQHHFIAPGVYNVTLTRKIGGVFETKTQSVTILQGPKAPVLLETFSKRDSSLCDPIELVPYRGQIVPTSYTYEWYPKGQTTGTIMADTSDLYSLKVTSSNGCTVVASAAISICGTPKPPGRQSLMEYHFGDGMVRRADHGNPQFATDFPVNEQFAEPGVVHSRTAGSSIGNPNMYWYQSYMFTSDGNNIYDKSNIVATNIAGGGNALQTIIVPKVEGDTLASTQYYVLTVNSIGQLSYTLLDSRTGNAVVIKKNVTLIENMTGKMAVSKYLPGIGYQIVCLGNDGKYYTFKINKLGLFGPVVSNGGVVPNDYGQIKFSPDGKKIINPLSGPPRFEICDFDNISGKISNCAITNINTIGKIYGVEYSPDGNYIYYTLNGNGKSKLMRYDIANAKSMLVQEAEGTEDFGALEDVKIPGNQIELMMAVDGQNYFATLEKPNAYIIDSLLVDNKANITARQEILKFTLKSVKFQTAKGTLGLNNAVDLPPNSSSSNDAIEFKDDCVDANIIFQATPLCDVTKTNISYEINYGDGDSAGPTSNNKFSHAYKKHGTYPITLYITYCGKPPVIIKDIVVVYPKPEIDIQAFYENCFKTTPNFPVTVNVTNLNDMYIVYPNQLEFDWAGNNIVGSTDKNKVEVDVPTNLSLKVGYRPISNPPKTCLNKYTTKVNEFCPPTFVAPNIFTPNGDSINDILEIKHNGLDADNYVFRIFNRWGEMVYYSEILTEPNLWDGKFHGLNCPADSYAWSAEYKSRFKPTGLTYKSQGALLLVR